MEDKKICILYDFLDEVGGLERLMFHQVKFLTGKFQQELLFFYIDDSKCDDICKSLNLPDGITVRSIGKRRSKFNSLARAVLSVDLDGEEADVFMCYSFTTALAAYRRYQSDGTPYMVYLNHPPNFLYGRKLMWVNNFLRLCAFLIGLLFKRKLRAMDIEAIQHSAVVFANSEYTAGRIARIYNVTPSVIYPPIDNAFRIVSHEWAESHAMQSLPDEFVLMHGRMIPDKRPDWGVKAFAIVATANEKLHLVISGAEGNKSKVIKLIKNLGLEDRVTLLGYQTAEELVALYNLASVFLMSAPEEDFGLTPVEAIACGCPVVAWDDGCGPSETVKAGSTGVLAKPYDINAFASAIQEALGTEWNHDDFVSEAGRFSEENYKSSFSRTTKHLFSSIE